MIKVKEESEKVDLKLNIQKTRIMASSPIISWQIDGETMEIVRDFTFLGSQITADGDCSHEIKRCLLLGGKAITNLDSILKSRDITLLTKVCLVKGMVCPVVMYGWESWTIKKAERWRIDAFELWCWRRLLRVPWTAKRTNQSILKEISPEYSLEGLMLKLKLQYFGHLWEELTHWKRPWCWERLKAGGEGDDRGWDSWMVSLTQFEWTPGVGDGQGSPARCSPWGCKGSDTTEWLNWTDGGWEVQGQAAGKFCSDESLFLVCGQLAAHCVTAWPFLCVHSKQREGQRGRERVLWWQSALLIRTLALADKGPTLYDLILPY